MNHNELLRGLEERFDAVGHDIRLRSINTWEKSTIYCKNCRIEARVSSLNVGGWTVNDTDGQNLLPILDERCVGLISPDVLVSRVGVWQDAQDAIRDAEEAADQALAALDAAQYAYHAQMRVNA